MEYYKILIQDKIIMNFKNKILSAAVVLGLIFFLSDLKADDQLFGGSKEKDSESKKQATQQMVQDVSALDKC